MIQDEMRVGRKWKRVILLASFILLIYSLSRWFEWGTEEDWNGWLVSTSSWAEHKLCIIVPFRDRERELSEFVPHMQRFLALQQVSSVFLVVNQTDIYRFNRASLVNVGWFEADRVGCDYIVMHDVDLLPLNPALNYSFPGEGTVRHISSPEYHPKYKYDTFIGGILMLTTTDYKKLNGMSNKYWGWGLEDDEFFLRIRDAALSIERPTGLSSNREKTFKHIHGAERKRDFMRKGAANAEERREKKKRDRKGGLSTTRYRIISRSSLKISRTTVRVIHVELECDLQLTPYCIQR